MCVVKSNRGLGMYTIVLRTYRVQYEELWAICLLVLVLDLHSPWPLAAFDPLSLEHHDVDTIKHNVSSARPLHDHGHV